MYWFQITGEAPKNALQVEITGKQFSWIFRYPGKDNVFGNKYYKNISDAENNSLGLLWDDQKTHDDIVVNQTMYAVVKQPLKLIINSRDVIHDVGIVAFRMKMDAVPGTPTTMWFTPLYTTEEMKKMNNNRNLNMKFLLPDVWHSHYTMKGVIKVYTRRVYIMAGQWFRYIQR
jgi:cytochrome c oxidase subunit 2